MASVTDRGPRCQRNARGAGSGAFLQFSGCLRDIARAEGGGFEPPRDVTPNTDSRSTDGVPDDPAPSRETTPDQGKRGSRVRSRPAGLRALPGIL